MKIRAVFVVLTVLLVFLSVAGVSAMDNSTDDIVSNGADSSLNLDDIDIQHNYNPNYVVKGEYFKIVVNVTNNGQMDYYNLTLNYNLPDGLNPIISPTEYVNGTWTLDSLLVGESDTLTIVCMPTVSNTTVTSSLTYANQTLSTLDILIYPSADLAIEQARVYDGGLMYWIVHVVNNGPDDGLNTVVFNLPEYLSYQTDIGEVAANQWNVGNLKSGSDALLVLICEPFDRYSYSFLVLSDIYDPDMSNNNASGSFSHYSSDNTSVRVTDTNQTGNPFAVLLLSLLMIPLTRFRRL